MLFFDSISEILDDIIQSKMDISACRSLLDSLLPYGYHSSDTGCYDLRKEIIINSDANYHITAYDLPYIDACEKLVKFFSNDSDAYPVLFAMVESAENRLDYYACSLIKIFSCAYENPALVIFVSDERVAFGTVRSEAQIEDNFCLSDWFLPSDFDTKITFVEDAYALSEVAGWIKENSQLEKSKRGYKRKEIKADKLKSWNYNCYDFNLDYIYAMYEIEKITGVSTLRQRNEYYMSYDENNRDNRPDVTDEAECGSTEYTFDDIASEISYVGNTTHFDELDEYSDDLESSEINGTTMAESDYSDDFDLLNYDEDIPEDVLNDPEKLLKYLSSNKSGFVSKDERNSSQSVKDVEAQQITLDSMEENEPVNIQESKPVSYDIGIPQPAGIATVDKKPHIDVSNVELIDCSWIEEPSVIDTHKTDSSDELSGEKPLADVVQDLETLVGDLFEGASLANEVSVEETTENDVSEEKPLSDVVQDLETAINGLFDDEQEAEPVVNYDDNRETSIGEAHEPETLASDMPEEDPVVSEMKESETSASDVSEEPVVGEVQECEELGNDSSEEEPAVDDVQELETIPGNITEKESETDETLEHEALTVDGTEELATVKEQEPEILEGDVSWESSIADEIQNSETADNIITKKKISPDISGMISHFELISMVNVHSETVFRYIRDKKIIPDRVIKRGSRSVYYFTPENVKELISKCDWHIISESNKRRVFLQMIDRMTMSFSYKPVFIKAIFATAKNGKSSMSRIVAYFRNFYEARRKSGLFVEKPSSIFACSGYTDKDVKKLILVYPYKRFAEMQIFTYSKLFGTVSMDPNVWSSLHSSEIDEICQMCDEHIDTYYSRFK